MRLCAVVLLSACNLTTFNQSTSDASTPGDAGVPDASVVITTPTEVVTTTSGEVRGETIDHVNRYLGIRYAAPPTGALRWKPPALPPSWDGVRDATHFGAQCAQNLIVASGSEDCLFLNVWAPMPAIKRPVMFWIHGGAFTVGGADSLYPGLHHGLYDGQSLADTQQVLVVSLNYRLGPLGFLAIPELVREDAHGSAGNYGLLDQIAALRWVHENIAAFGGDPAQVMIFGESAGAYSVCALLASPLAAGLFSSALMESGVCEMPTLSYRQTQQAQFAKQYQCDGASDALACLRAVPVDQLVAVPAPTFPPPGPADLPHVSALSYGPNADGWVLPKSPIAMLRDGTFNRVPVVIGSNQDEMAYFLKQGSIPTCVQYDALVLAQYGSSATKVLQRYRCLTYLTPTDAMIDLSTDLQFTCPARRALRAISAVTPGHAYRYSYAHTMSLSQFWADRAFHTAEIPFVFDSFSAMPMVPTQNERELSASMQGYWARFAATGNPNGATALAWSPYVPANDNALVLDTPMSTTSAIKTANCDLWDSLVEP